MRASDDRGVIDQPGGVFVRKAVAPDGGRPDAAARRRRAVVLVGDRGSLASQLDRIERPRPPRRASAATPRRRARRGVDEPVAAARRPALRQRPRRLHARRPRVRASCVQGPARGDSRRNGTVDRHVAAPLALRLPPAPWINVVANPVVRLPRLRERARGYTWAGNSQTNRLTPWSNDPVSDPPGEVVYLRDEETGEVWTPTPLPSAPAEPIARPPRPGLHGLRAQQRTGWPRS